MASDLVMTLDAQALAPDKLAGHDALLVDFWAPWCGPCRMIAPILEALAKDMQGSVVIGKLNIDDFPNIAEQYGVQSIPTMVLFKKGAEVERLVGVRSKDALATAIRAHL